MGKSSPSAPTQPNPFATAEAQMDVNRQAALLSAALNQFNIQSPYGSRTFTGEIGSPERTMQIGLPDQLQSALEAQQGLTADLTGAARDMVPRVTGMLGQPLDFSGAPQVPGMGDLQQFGNEVEQATFQRGMNLLQPEMQAQQARQSSELRGAGFMPGSAAWNEEQDRLARNQQLQQENLAMQAVGAGRAEQSRMANMMLPLRQQAIAEQLQLRQQPLAELSSLLQGSPQFQAPQFPVPGGQGVAPADIQGAVSQNYLADINAYNLANRQRAQTLGGLMNLGGTLAAGYFF